MKRTLIIILIVALLCTALCACGKDMRGDGNVGDGDGIITDGDKDRDPDDDGKGDTEPDVKTTDEPKTSDVPTAIPTQPITP